MGAYSFSLGYGDVNIELYNNSVKMINGYARDYIKNSNKISVRSVGSNPQNPDSENTTMYESERLAQYLNGKYNGIGKGPDGNAEQDIIRMSFHEVATIGEKYWLASRSIVSFGDEVEFCLNCMGDNERLCQYNVLWYVNEITVGSYSFSGDSYAVRPVVKVNKADVGL